MHATLTNPRSDRVRRVRHLLTSTGRRRARAFLVEGPQGVREVTRWAPQRVRDVYMTVEASQRLPEIVDACADGEVFLHLCSPQVVEVMSPDAQGVVAVVNSQEDIQVDFGSTGASGGRFFVGLVQARDPGNVGAIIRAADAAGAAGVVLTKGSVSVENPKVVRSSAGSMFHVPIAWGMEPEDLVHSAVGGGLQVLATTAGASTSFTSPDLDLTQPTLWLFGNEAHGLDPDVVQRAHREVSIPIYGHAESLNLAMAATLCLYRNADVL